MNVWDAELLMAKKELSPVTDGLLFWLDGQDELFHYESPNSERKDYMYERVNVFRKILHESWTFSGIIRWYPHG